MQERFYHLISKKLSDSASISDLTELESLLHNDAAKQQEYEAIMAFWKSTNPVLSPDSKAFDRHIQRLRAAGYSFAAIGPNPDDISGTSVDNPAIPVLPINKGSRWKKWLVAAGMVGLISTLLWLTRYAGNATEQVAGKKIENLNEVQTRPGSRSKMVLPDGSQVWVNASSRLTYDQQFGKSHRNIQLDGEAYFMVEKNEGLPFVLHTKNISIRVTGTVFNVRAYDNENRTETALVEGSVQVQVNANPDKVYQLKPSQKLVVSHGSENQEREKSATVRAPMNKNENAMVALTGVNYTASDSLLVETAWLYGTLAFNDESFMDVSKKMEKWFDVEIIFESSKLEKIRFTGTFTKESINEALEALRYTANFKFRQNGNRIIIYH